MFDIQVVSVVGCDYGTRERCLCDYLQIQNETWYDNWYIKLLLYFFDSILFNKKFVVEKTTL